MGKSLDKASYALPAVALLFSLGWAGWESQDPRSCVEAERLRFRA